MATIRDFFETDFKNYLSSNRVVTITSRDSGESAEAIARLHYVFDANALFISFYVPATDHQSDLCSNMLSRLDFALDIAKTAHVTMGRVGEEGKKDSELKFIGSVFLYVDGELTVEARKKLASQADERGLSLVVRDQTYASRVSALQKPKAFISHDSRDKDDVARPLAKALSKLCPIWFDEYSLKIGDSLRESIEKGLKDCEKCIVIISPEFLSNSGWTKAEFNSIFTRELIEDKQLILPVWHGVSKREVYEYSPSLADKVAAQWRDDPEEVARALYKSL